MRLTWTRSILHPSPRREKAIHIYEFLFAPTTYCGRPRPDHVLITSAFGRFRHSHAKIWISISEKGCSATLCEWRPGTVPSLPAGAPDGLRRPHRSKTLARTSGRHSPSGDDPRRERQTPTASPAREGLRPAVPVPEAGAAGQYYALAAAPVWAGEHYLLPGFQASRSHTPSVTPGVRPFTVNPPEVE